MLRSWKVCDESYRAVYEICFAGNEIGRLSSQLREKLTNGYDTGIHLMKSALLFVRDLEERSEHHNYQQKFLGVILRQPSGLSVDGERIFPDCTICLSYVRLPNFNVMQFPSSAMHAIKTWGISAMVTLH